MMDTDDETKDDNTERDRLQKQIRKAEQANQETFKQLGMRGMDPSPLELTRLRVEVFISMTLGGGDSINRLKFELAWQKQLAEYFSSMYQESQKSKLHVPGRG